ncbi:MAG: hypothetical protein QOD32_410 [Pyrinomonadaceae bacterium]|jgi:hypothetical protein|nr:hypothetical protein [Pyrinomonadaceae bacterium]
MKFPLSVRSGGASLAVAVSLLVANVPAQRPAAPPKPAPTAVAATQTPRPTPAAEQSPSVTFDTLLSADAYGIYAEMRAVGRHAGSQEIAQLIAPFNFEGGGAPDELLALYEFLKSHADELMTSRVMFATMPARSGLPEVLLAVEMPSIEEARKFVPELRRFVAANVAPVSPDRAVLTTTSTAAGTNEAAAKKPVVVRHRVRQRTRTQAAGDRAAEMASEKLPAVPPVHIKRSGQLIAMSNTAFTFKNLSGADQPLLVNEPGFQAARTRFSTDTLFVYFNTVRMGHSSKQRNEALEKEYQRQAEAAREAADKENGAAVSVERNIGSSEVVVNMNTNANSYPPMSGSTNATNANIATSPEDETPTAPTPEATPEPTPSPKSEKELEEERQREQSRQFAQTLGSLVFGGRGESSEAWPESIGIGASLDADALVLRGLFVNASADEPLRPIPFLPALLSGPSLAAEAPAVLPADTDILLSVSLDLPQMYDYLASLMKIGDLAAAAEGSGKSGFGDQLTAFEKTNNFRIREELLAALGNEIAVGMPGDQFFGGRSARRRSTGYSSASPPQSGPVVVIALNDKEALQKLLPRVLAAIGFAGATEESVVEKHGQVEVLTFSNGTLAFIDRFLVSAPDAATMRRVTDAYNRGETLANDERFRDSTHWQSKQAVGQVYVSNEMLKTMFEDVTRSADDIDDPAVRAYLLQLDPDPGSITHLATRESNGLMHELRLPKNLFLLLAASELVSQKLSTIRGNESTAQWKLRMIQEAQGRYKSDKGGYGTLAELNAEGFINDVYSQLEAQGYEIKLSVSGDKFEATATPTGYPKLGRRSFYIDQTGSLRGADTGGKPASESTPLTEQ